jgi:hypothetical protein
VRAPDPRFRRERTVARGSRIPLATFFQFFKTGSPFRGRSGSGQVMFSLLTETRA